MVDFLYLAWPEMMTSYELGSATDRKLYYVILPLFPPGTRAVEKSASYWHTAR